MKGTFVSKLKWLAAGLLLIVYAQNCTKADFAEAPADPSQAGKQNIDGEIPIVEPEPPVVPPVTPPANPNVFPKLSWDYEYCPDYSDCPKTFILSFADARTITLKWRTNEVTAANNTATSCQPKVGYMPTDGTLTYLPGQTKAVAIVKSLDCSSDKTIPLSITECRANGVMFDCNLLR